MSLEFYKYLRETKKVRDKTARLYVRAVALCLADKDPLEVFADETIGASRKDTYRKALSHYAEWKEDSRLWDQVRGQKIKGRNRRKKTPVALNLQVEWPALLAEVAKLPEPLHATLYLLSTSGLRVAEILDLSKATLSVALRDGQAQITQKGGELRWFSIASEGQWTSVSTLLDEMRGGKTTVWQVLTGGRRHKRSSVEYYLSAELKRAATRAGIKKAVHPHTLRKTVADAVRASSGGDMKLVQEVLGHRSVKTTFNWYQDHQHPEEVHDALAKALEGIV